MRAYFGMLQVETNTFSPIPCGDISFKRPPDIEDIRKKMLAPFRDRAIECCGDTAYIATPSGTVKAATYDRLRDELLNDLRACLPVDFVYLSLHGAMVAENEDDCEGDIIKRVRDIVGAGVIIGVHLDPHCHLSEAMVRYSDIAVMYLEYPHTDVIIRGVELANLMISIKERQMKPIASVAECPTISLYHTKRTPMKEFLEKIRTAAQEPGVISISIAHGFPWADVPDIGTKVLVYSTEEKTGTRVANSLAAELFALRGATFEPAFPYVEVLGEALARPTLTVVADVSDNPGGGAAGDSTFLLRELVNRNCKDCAVGVLWDPMAVRTALEAGVGSKLQIRVGGKQSEYSGQPLDVQARVLAVERNLEINVFDTLYFSYGDVVSLAIDPGVVLLISSLRQQVFNPTVFERLGIDVQHLRVIVVKSQQHFRTEFEKLTSDIVYAAAPGALSFDFKNIKYLRVTRPLWPRDPAVRFLD